jgi:3-oxoacyl-[acyl-carrier-protein] synthase III
MADFQMVGIRAIDYFLGQKTVDNSQLKFENPSWDMSKTEERTGVLSRPIAIDGTTALDLAYEASALVLKKLQDGANEIDALIFCTQTPDYILPSNSSLLHNRLNLNNNVMAFDITHACSGFIYGVGIARGLIASGNFNTVLLVTADTYSRLIHPNDRSIRPLFGDGAAATIISSDEPLMKILDMSFGTSGKHYDRFIIEKGGCRNGVALNDDDVQVDKGGRIKSPNHIYMDGLGLLSFFNSAIPKSVNELLDKNSKKISDISFFVFHQASQLALEGIARNMKIPENKMIIDMSRTGNLVSSSIPVLLADLLKRKTFSKGQLVVICGFGVGLSWGTALVQF